MAEFEQPGGDSLHEDRSARTHRRAGDPLPGSRMRRPSPGSPSPAASASPAGPRACRRQSSCSVPAANSGQLLPEEHVLRAIAPSTASGIRMRRPTPRAPRPSRTTARHPTRPRSAERERPVSPASGGLQTKYAPSGPCSSSPSPASRSCTRNGETSPVGQLVDGQFTEVPVPEEAIEYEPARLVSVRRGQPHIEMLSRRRCPARWAHRARSASRSPSRPSPRRRSPMPRCGPAPTHQ